MSEQVHQHVPEELSERTNATTRRGRYLEVVAIVMLSTAAIGTAWSGYQAARWAGREAHRFAESDALHSRSTRAVARAGENRVQDVSDFEHWLDLESTGNTALADVAVQHFRDELRAAFDPWLAQDPLHNPGAIPTPLKMPQYHSAQEELASHLEAEGDHNIELGTTARDRADEYVLITVFFASVLFFAGISLRVRSERLQMVVLGIGVAFLVYGAVQLVVLPRLL